MDRFVYPLRYREYPVGYLLSDRRIDRQMGIWIDGRAVGQLSVSRGIPCRAGPRAACDTVLREIPCRVGYRAAQDNVPSGMLRRTGYPAFVCFRLVCFRSGRLLVDILGDARVYFGRSEAVDAVIVAARSSGWVTLSSTTIISTLTTIISTLTTIKP